MGDICYLTGPVRSGKSRRAVELAKTWGEGVVFVATYRADANDDEMRERIRRHRGERPAWRTLEAPADVAESLSELAPPPTGVVLDCLTLWLSDRFERSDETLIDEWNALLATLLAAPWPVVIVGNEVGWSPVPESAELRRFRDLAGTLAQCTAARASEAWLLVAGCLVRLK
ncbi:MAG: bifunctional adenosylcobalamin biosynthesis protein CobU [Pseudomonadota bacterium]|jgi:adenosylcobinamide kinase/adenosylcobinamide-phosphate guanylyltransferase